MKIILAILLIVVCNTTITYGQTQKATTDAGVKVLLNSDGTWKYAPDSTKNIQSNIDSNDCSNWIETVTDKVDGSTYSSGKKTLVVTNDAGKTGFRILILKGSDNGLTLSIRAKGASSCIDNRAKINILFTDGSRLELSNDGSFNCDANSTVYFGGVWGKMKSLDELKNKNIQTLRVWTSKSYVEQDFTYENQIEFKNVITCISNL